ncbi:hypothetical protein DFS34DRAFT_505323 [Phlyctochytrium arcticum]|nr:hypothetical protein DFS34DRAFT_505323 [Phlyctochytrium arcticum]
MSKTQKKSSSNPTSSSAFPPVKGASHTPALPADAQRPYTAAELKDKGETRPQTTWKLPPPSRRIGASASASPTKPSRSHDIRREKSMPERVRTQMTRPQTTAGGGSPEALSKYQSADSGRRPPFAVPAGRKLEDAPIIKVEAETVRKTLKDPTVSRPSTTAALAKEVGSSNGDGDDTDDAERGDDEGSEKIHDIAQWQAYAQKRWPWKAAYANQRRAERLHMGKSSGYGRMEGKASEASSSVSGFWKKSGSHFISQIGLTAWAVTSADLVQQKQKQLYRQSLARNHATGEWKRDGKMAAHARRRGNATQELK